MKTIIFFLCFCVPCFAECITDPATGDRTCVDGDITYVYPSEATLAKRESEQAIVEARRIKDERRAELQDQIDQLAQDIMNASADDDIPLVAHLKEQRATLKAELNGLE